MMMKVSEQNKNNVLNVHLKRRSNIAKIITEILPQRLLSDVSSEYIGTSSDEACLSSAGILPEKIVADTISVKNYIPEEPEHTLSVAEKNNSNKELNKNRDKKKKLNKKVNKREDSKTANKEDSKRNHKEKVMSNADTRVVNEKGDISHPGDDLERNVSKDKKSKHKSILGFHIGKVKIRFKKSTKKISTSESTNILETKEQDKNELHGKNHGNVTHKELSDTDDQRSNDVVDDDATTAITLSIHSKMSFYDVKSPSYTVMQQEIKGLTPELYMRLSSEESACLLPHMLKPRSPLATFSNNPSRQCSKHSRRDSYNDPSMRSQQHTPRCSRRVIEPETKTQRLQCGSSNIPLPLVKRSSPDVGGDSRGGLRKKWHLLNCCTPPRPDPSCCSTKCCKQKESHKPPKCCSTPPKCYTPKCCVPPPKCPPPPMCPTPPKCCAPPPKCPPPPMCPTPPKCCAPPPKCSTPPKSSKPRCKQKCCQSPKPRKPPSGCPRCCPPTPSTPTSGCSKSCPKEKNHYSKEPVDCVHKFCKLMEAVGKVNSELNSSIGSGSIQCDQGSNDFDNLLGIEASTNNLVCELKKLLCHLEAAKSSYAQQTPKTGCKPAPPPRPKCCDQRPRYSFCDGGQSNATDITLENSCASQDSSSFNGDTTCFSGSTSVESFNLRTDHPNRFDYDEYSNFDYNDPYAYCTPPKSKRCAEPYVAKPSRAPRRCSRHYEYEPPHFKAKPCGTHPDNYPPACNRTRPLPKQDVCGRGRVVDIETPMLCPVPTRKAACPGPHVIKQMHSCSCSDKRERYQQGCYYVLWNGGESAKSGFKDSDVHEKYSENSICDQLRSVLHALERNGKKLAQFDMSRNLMKKTEPNDFPLSMNSSAEITQSPYNKQQFRYKRDSKEIEKNYQSISSCEFRQIQKKYTAQKESNYCRTCSNDSYNSHSISETRSDSLISSQNSKLHPKANIYNSILSNFCYEQTRNIYQGQNSNTTSKTKLRLNLKRFASLANATGLKKYLREILSMYDQPRDKSNFEQKENSPCTIYGHDTSEKQSLTFYGQVKQYCNPKVEYYCKQQDKRAKLEENLRPVCYTPSKHRTRLQDGVSPTCCVLTKQRTSPQRKTSRCCHDSNSRISLQQSVSSKCCHQEQRLKNTCCSQPNKRSSNQCKPIPLCCVLSKHKPNSQKSHTCCTQPKKKSLTCCSKPQPVQKGPSPICCRQPKPRRCSTAEPTPTRCCNSKRPNLQRKPSPTCCTQPKRNQCPIAPCCEQLKNNLNLLQKQLSSTCCNQPKQKSKETCCQSKPNKSQKCSKKDVKPIDISDCVDDIRCKIFKLAELLEKIESYQSIPKQKYVVNAEEAALQKYSDKIRCDMLNILNKIERTKNCINKNNIKHHQGCDNKENRLKLNACEQDKKRPMDVESCTDIITDNLQKSKQKHRCSNKTHHRHHTEHKATSHLQDTSMPYYDMSSYRSNEFEADELNISSVIDQKLTNFGSSKNERKTRRAEDSNYDRYKQTDNIENDQQSQTSIIDDPPKNQRQISNRSKLNKEYEYRASNPFKRNGKFEEYYNEDEDDACSVGSQISRNTEMIEETQCSHDFLVQDIKDDPRIAFLPQSDDAEVNRSLREEIKGRRSGTRDWSNSEYETKYKSQRSPSGHRVRYSDEDEVYYTNIGEKDTSCQCDLPCENIIEMSEDELRQRCHGFTYDDLDTIYKRDIANLKSKLTQVTSGFKFKKNMIESHLVPKRNSNNLEENKENVDNKEDADLKENYSNYKHVAYSKIKDRTNGKQCNSRFHFLSMIVNLFKKSNKCNIAPTQSVLCERCCKNGLREKDKDSLCNEMKTKSKCQGCGAENCPGLGPPGILPKPTRDVGYPTCMDEIDKEFKEKIEGPVDCACKKDGKIVCECPAPLCPNVTNNKKSISKPCQVENPKPDQIKTKPQKPKAAMKTDKPINTDSSKQDKVDPEPRKAKGAEPKREIIEHIKPEVEETESQTLDSENEKPRADSCECFDCGCAGADDDNCNCTEDVPADCFCTDTDDNELSKGFKFTVLKNPGKTFCGEKNS